MENVSYLRRWQSATAMKINLWEHSCSKVDITEILLTTIIIIIIIIEEQVNNYFQ